MHQEFMQGSPLNAYVLLPHATLPFLE